MIQNPPGGKARPMSEAEAREIAAARARMIARHQLIEGIIKNNELQLKNESARGGAEIERECATRDAARAGAGPDDIAELRRITERMEALEVEHRRLVAEREWLNAALLDFENGVSPEEHSRSGHA